MSLLLDATDRALINRLQQGLPIVDAPYAAVAAELSLSEDELLQRLQQLLDCGALSRFGPMYHAERIGGGLTLAAMAVDEVDLDRVVAQINALPEVAHNYLRDHPLNLWFVLATERPQQIDQLLAQITTESGYPVYNMPRIEEFYVGLQLQL